MSFKPTTQHYLFSTILIMGFYFSSYRYPLQIGDTGTSPTYTDTPIFIQIIKYALFAIMLPFQMVVIRKSLVRFRGPDIVIFIFSVISITMCMFVMLYDFSVASRLFEIGFFMLFGLIFSYSSYAPEASKYLLKFIKWFIVIDVITIIIQLFLYYTVGRLPALGYEGGNVRFGGVWDDPNSALVPFIIFAPYLLVRDGIAKNSLIVLLITAFVIVLAQSVTSTIALLISASLVFFLFYRDIELLTKCKMAALGVVSAIAVGGSAFFAYMYFWKVPLWQFAITISELILLKADSAQMRSASYIFQTDITILTILGIDPIMATGENTYINILLNFGVMMLMLYILIHGWVIRCLYRWTQNSSGESYAIAIAFSTYYIWYVLAMINIPMAEVFPVNLIALIIAGISLQIGGSIRSAGKSRKRIFVLPRRQVA